jgi:hypothetical protein
VVLLDYAAEDDGLFTEWRADRQENLLGLLPE